TVLLDVFLFFSSRRRHTRFSRDWSSDVCSSDLSPGLQSWEALRAGRKSSKKTRSVTRSSKKLSSMTRGPGLKPWVTINADFVRPDRKSVVQGKCVEVGGRLSITNKGKVTNNTR